MSVSTGRTVVAVVLLVSVAAMAGCVGPFDDGDVSTPEPTSTPTTEPASTPTQYAEVHESYEKTTVTAVDNKTGAQLGSVEAAIADNNSLRFTGLSDTEVLPPDSGMLFVYDDESERSYVMREMSFGIDMVFIRSDGTIESIYHARAPEEDEDGNSIGHSATAQYVLEVNLEWTTEHGVEEGDRIEFELPE